MTSTRQVAIYHAPHLSTPCCLVEPTQEHQLEVLPATYWKQYNDASRLVEQIKRKTPKVPASHLHFFLFLNNGP